MLSRLLENHRRYTGSMKAQRILGDWDRYAEHFIKVVPDAYASVVERSINEGQDIRPLPPPPPHEVATA
jgi:glutamate synthase (NADPH/NADH) large chain